LFGNNATDLGFNFDGHFIGLYEGNDVVCLNRLTDLCRPFDNRSLKEV
jgi:hypothetical protein